MVKRLLAVRVFCDIPDDGYITGTESGCGFDLYGWALANVKTRASVVYVSREVSGLATLTC